MPRPTYPSPVFPTEDTPSSIGSAKCGGDWHIPHEIRAPYKTTDKYVNVLPAIYGDFGIQADKSNPGAVRSAVDKMTGSSFQTSLKNAVKGAKELLQNYYEDGYIDLTNRNAIRAMITRSETYIERAAAIRKWWEESYRPDQDKPVYGWPLQSENMNGCPGFYPTKGSVFTMVPGQGSTTVEFNCPTLDDKQKHEDDAYAYQQFLYAALINIRCAQEAAAAVGTFNRNKEYHEEQYSGGMQLAPGVPKPSPGTTLAPSVP
ncbi:MAG: hypothetical protein ACYTBS_04325, partial [Planctomycetota bacterium]